MARGWWVVLPAALMVSALAALGTPAGAVAVIPGGTPTSPVLPPIPPTTIPVPTAPATVVPSFPARGPALALGDSGASVLAVQKRLTDLGYWLGPPDGDFSDSTQQAVFALQKAAGISPDGDVGQQTWKALAAGALPTPRTSEGYVIQVDLADDLLMVVDNGKLKDVLNTSTGGGYEYVEEGVTSVAETPTGVYHVFRQVDGTVTDPLGQLWRPKFFYSGYAIHGDSYVPSVPVSHGCVRVSNEAIDWIWADQIIPIGTEVWVY